MRRFFVELLELLPNSWSRRALGVVGLMYLMAMFVIPAIRTELDWIELQKVWDRWQSLNVGVLAFSASYVALQIARVDIAEKNRRDFVAARAFMPKALNDLATYCSRLAHLLLEIRAELSDDSILGSMLRPERALPGVPDDVYQTLEKCIRTAPDEVAAFLADLLSTLQVIQARSASLVPQSVALGVRPMYTSRAPANYLANVAVLRIQINQLFSFARFEQDSMPTQVDISTELKNVVRQLNIPDAQVPFLKREGTRELEQYAKRRGLSLIGESVVRT
jgi:hypothetical protein